MTRLIVAPDDTPNDVLTDTEKPQEIAAALATVGVRFEQWATTPVAATATDADVLAAYSPDVERLQREGGYVTVDVARLHRGDEPASEWSAKAAGAR